MDSYLLTLHRSFVADHFHDLPGFVEERHGHNWEIETTVRLDAAIDSKSEALLIASLSAWILLVDYTLLNGQPALKNRNPTAEALSQWAYLHLRAAGLDVECVRIREKANYWAGCRSAA